MVFVSVKLIFSMSVPYFEDCRYLRPKELNGVPLVPIKFYQYFPKIFFLLVSKLTRKLSPENQTFDSTVLIQITRIVYFSVEMA